MSLSYPPPKIMAIVGPTASGKTELAIKLAKKFNGEIVSADSRQIYREMDIGTAKPPISQARRSRALAKSSVPSNDGTYTPLISKGVPHHLIDIRNPDQSYTVAQYKRDAIKAIKEILKKGKVPFLVGGTGQYVSAVIENWEIPKVKANEHLRARLEKLIQKRGLAFAFKKLIRLDPEAAYIVDPKNPRRVIRALEVSILSGQPFSKLRKKNNPYFQTLILGLNPKPESLKKSIAQRTKTMIKLGLVKEVKTLMKKYGSRRVPFDAIGYREVIQHLEGQVTLDEAIDLINKNTWHFARRQMTWFRRLPVVWITSQKETEKEIEKFLKN